MSEARERAIAEDEARFGARRDESRTALRNTLRKARPLVDGHEKVFLATDEKPSYPRLAAEAFGAKRLVHEQTNSELARLTWNPLFPINHTEAVMRDLMGRLRRESWLVSKKGRFLDLALQLFMAYRNFVRRRFNYDDHSPAQILGFAPRRMTEQELLSWRQDWRGKSIHPLARRAESHEDRARRTARAA